MCLSLIAAFGNAAQAHTNMVDRMLWAIWIRSACECKFLTPCIGCICLYYNAFYKMTAEASIIIALSALVNAKQSRLFASHKIMIMILI